MSQTGSFTRLIDTTKTSKRVLQLRESFAKRIVGQEKATDALTRAIDIFFGGLNDPRRPISNILFLGPTGVGKTVTVEAFAYGLFGSRDAMIKIDCGEFQHGHEIAKLIGSPPGYLGHKETPPRLNQAALEAHQTAELPFNIILFDEIEKASDDMWHLLLGIMDKATLTQGDNSKTDFTKSIIVMTSNVGAAQMATVAGETALGFQPEDRKIDPKRLEDIAMSAARRKFTPEFLNRLDDIVMFDTLSEKQVNEIMELELKYLEDKLIRKNIARLTLSPAAKRAILKAGFDTKYNARALRRVIEREIMLPIARGLSSEQIKKYDDVLVSYNEKGFEFYAKPSGYADGI